MGVPFRCERQWPSDQLGPIRYTPIRSSPVPAALLTQIVDKYELTDAETSFMILFMMLPLPDNPINNDY